MGDVARKPSSSPQIRRVGLAASGLRFVQDERGKGRNMFDHAQIKVDDLHGSRPFYEAVLGALGYKVVFEVEGVVVGIGTDPHNMFEIRQAEANVPVSKSTHIAFTAKSESAVRAFHSVALAHGATDNGMPGLRPQYESGYFAAFVIDPNGHNLEAVFIQH